MAPRGEADVTASYIAKLRSSAIPSLVQKNTIRSHSQHATRWATRQSMDAHSLETNSRLSEDHGLPSFVPESDDLVNTNEISPIHLRKIPFNVAKKFRAMSSQGEWADGTQRISQSIYESLLRKERSARNESTKQSKSQDTREEGDSGHVDITSSFVTGSEPEDELAGSEPTELSPDQTQPRLTQYPESERFKTPATAGRKRKHNGEIVDTPIVPSNPLAQDGQKTPHGMLGLSQAFAATQACSSPLTNALPTGPRSDRPSPGIEWHSRVVGISSSPSLRPLNENKRMAAEPASRYVPMEQSQADRQRLVGSDSPIDDSHTGVFDDDFKEDSQLLRKRRYNERGQKTKHELKLLSRRLPCPSGAPVSVQSERQPQYPQNSRRTQSLPPESPSTIVGLGFAHNSADSESEAETEVHEDDDVDVRCSSQDFKLGIGEEDKENASVLVPKTGPRRRHVPIDTGAKLDSSPSYRQQTRSLQADVDGEMPSSEPCRIMDSQPSQSRKVLYHPVENIDSAAEKFCKELMVPPNVTDVCQAQAMDIRGSVFDYDVQGTQLPHHYIDSKQHVKQDKISACALVSNDDANGVVSDDHMHSEVRNTKSRPESEDQKTSSLAESNTTMATATTAFETAPPYRESVPNIEMAMVSSPIHTTPPGRKRRRLLEISADPSPHKSQGQVSFDAKTVLQLDEDESTAVLLCSSPHRLVAPAQDATMSTDLVVLENADIHSRPEQSTATAEHQSQKGGQANLALVEGGTNQVITIPELDMSQDIIRPGRQVQPPRDTADTESSATNASTRTSVFDLEASPSKVEIPPTRYSQRLKTPNLDISCQLSSPTHIQIGVREDRSITDMKTTQNLTISTSDISDKKAASEEDDRDSTIAPHMVLAYYKGDPRGYYPAKLLSVTSSGGHRIQWEGCEPGVVDTYGVKALDLRRGDVIKVLASEFSKQPYVIRGFGDKVAPGEDALTDIRGHRTLQISAKPRKMATNPGTHVNRVLEVPVSQIYLDVNMWAQMKFRNTCFEPVETATTTTTTTTAAHGTVTPVTRDSTPATPSSRSRRHTGVVPASSAHGWSGIFANMAFAISYDDMARKNTLAGLIRQNGGLVLNEAFQDLLELNSIVPRSQYANMGFTVLLTERHSRKEKYMQALALGIPCISGKWVESSVRHNRLLDWRLYLLPAGESTELENATRSRVLPEMDISTTKFHEIVGHRPNILDGAMVAVVVSRGKAEAKRAPYLFLIKAMGAGEVRKFADVELAQKFLRSEDGAQYGWVFLDDKEVDAMRDLLNRSKERMKHKKLLKSKSSIGKFPPTCKVAGNELIVQSLILGKLYEI